MSKAFVGESQVYPPVKYDIVEATKYCVAKVTYAKVYPAFHKDDGRPVVATTKHPSGGTAVWEMKDGLPVGEPTGYDYYGDNPNPVESADYYYKRLLLSQKRAVQNFIDSHTISQTDSVPYDDGRENTPSDEMFAKYKGMGDLKKADWSSGDDLFVAKFFTPNNSWYPGAYVYYLSGESDRNNRWENHTFQNGKGVGEGAWIFISETPLFDWEDK